jgi:hypothetical protein
VFIRIPIISCYLFFSFKYVIVQSGAKSSLVKRQENSRIESRFNELKSIFDSTKNTRFQISTHVSFDELIDVSSIKSYFDLGCGNGLITTRVGQYFNLNSSQIFGGDVFNSNNSQFTFVAVDDHPSTIHLGSLSSIDVTICL